MGWMPPHFRSDAIAVRLETIAVRLRGLLGWRRLLLYRLLLGWKAFPVLGTPSPVTRIIDSALSFTRGVERQQGSSDCFGIRFAEGRSGAKCFGVLLVSLGLFCRNGQKRHAIPF